MESNPKKPATKMRATLDCLLTAGLSDIYLKQQASQIIMQKTIADILRILNTTYILTLKNTFL